MRRPHNCRVIISARGFVGSVGTAGRSGMDVERRGPGRPHKFGRPSRAVTVTLPEDVIARLSAIDVDLGRAIVAVVQRRRLRPAAKRPAELESYGSRSV